MPSTLDSYRKKTAYYLIDNQSTDDSIEYINEWHPEYKVIENTKNYGFAGGYNKGIHHINEEYIALINSDIECTDDWISPIIELMEKDKTVAAVQPKILSIESPNSFEYAGAAGGMIDTLGYPFCRGRIFDSVEDDNGQYDQQEEIFWASGAAFVIRKSIFEQFNGFDEDYFAHQEEIDLCWRIKRAGYKIMFEPKSVVYHLGGGTLSYESPRKTFLNFRNNLTTIIKNEETNWVGKFFMRLVLDGVAGVKMLSEGKVNNTLAILRAHLAIYSSMGSILKKRRDLTKLIDSVKIGPFNKAGLYPKSIIYAYFIKKIQTYTQLEVNEKE